MKSQLKNTTRYIVCSAFLLIGFIGCKKEEEAYPEMPNAVYITQEAVTGPFLGSSTAVTNSATGSIKVTPIRVRVYVNTLKKHDVVVSYTLTGSAVAGTHYTIPDNRTITIPAGTWFQRIEIPTIVSTLPANRTLGINLTTEDPTVQLGIGPRRQHATFVYTLTN
jgi:hypothetical protein